MQPLKGVLCLFFSLLAGFSGLAQEGPEIPSTDIIRLNQIGFYPEGPKVAVVVNDEASKFEVVKASNKKSVFEGALSEASEWDRSNEVVRQADFSDFSKKGTYMLHVPGVGYSHPFEIKKDVHKDAAEASLKGFYFMRASTDLPEEYAGTWARDAGHADTEVKVHNSAATESRPSESLISSPGGWYDAGDYNKYIVNSGITMGTLLSLYEDFPSYFKKQSLNIPESNNNLPDLLDEVLYNLRWMMTMQDEDGGVYHKLTSGNFHPAVMPKEATYSRWVVQKGTAASLDFAAVTAQASRIFREFDKELPGLSDSLVTASKSAYEWAVKNPDVAYVQKELRDPKISTGEYGDSNFDDEFQWAGAELFLTTGDKKHYQNTDIEEKLETAFGIPAWPNVNTLALYSLARHRDELKNSDVVDIEAITNQITSMADEYVAYSESSAYGTPMGYKESDFVWGSNSVAANQGILLINAYLITEDPKYLNTATDNLDYLMGRNATTYSFLTGYGEKPTRDPHHRPSEADENEEPVPGLLAGGPNPGQQDVSNCRGAYKEKHKYPATSYIDDRCSYASNEIAINWNSPYAYLSNAIEVFR